MIADKVALSRYKRFWGCSGAADWITVGRARRIEREREGKEKAWLGLALAVACLLAARGFERAVIVLSCRCEGTVEILLVLLSRGFLRERMEGGKRKDAGRRDDENEGGGGKQKKEDENARS